jgi:hypothetical protein
MRATRLLFALALCAPGGTAAQRDSVPLASGATRAAAAAHAVPALAEGRGTFGRGVVHYGKWLMAGSAVAFTVLGAREHDHSNHQFSALLDQCRANNATCTLGPDGRYLNPGPEALFQSSIEYDRRARVRLLAGQGALLVAAGLFIADLAHQAGGPANKPFSPFRVSSDRRTGRAEIGVALPF